MKVLIVGSGAREHALAWRLNQSPRLTGLWVADGNAGTASIATNLNVKPDDIPGLVAAAQSLDVNLVVVGPELPLSLGVVDQLTAREIAAFGPTREAARVETSKSFALEVMREAGVPCPEFRVFRQQREALDYLKSLSGTTVIKADGLAAGKGVFLCDTTEEAEAAVRDCMTGCAFGAAGETIVIEELLTGPEVSVFAFSDGKSLSSLVAACDYKRLEDGNHGPNTGGMGSFSPPDFWSESLAQNVERTVMQPMIDAMARRGTPYKGVLYAGLMLTAAGPKVLEFNCRLGDPETQVVLPLLATDPLDVMQACVEGRLDSLEVTWASQNYVGIVMASGGYPGAYETGFDITGLSETSGKPGIGPEEESGRDTSGPAASERDAMVFHAATRLDYSGNRPGTVSSGGRVLTVVGRGNSLAEARATAYDRVRRIHFQGAHYRTDIASVENRVVAWSPGPATPIG